MRIILCGTHSVGKSTLFERLRKEESLKDKNFLGETARHLFELGKIKNVGFECTHADQLTISEEHYKRILRHDHFISDRGALDAFVYASKQFADGTYSFHQLKQHEELFLRCMPHYDKIIFLPLHDQPFHEDGVRNGDDIYRQEINEMFIRLIKLYHLREKCCVVTTKESLDLQFEQMLEIVR